MNKEQEQLLVKLRRIIEERDAFKQCLERIKMRELNSHILASKVLDEWKEQA